MTTKHFILFDTEIGAFLQCSKQGELMVNYVIDEMLSGWDIFTEIEDKKIMKNALQLFDPKALKCNKHLVEMLPDYIKDNKVKKLSVTIEDQLIDVYGILVKNGIRKYITIELEPFNVTQFDSISEVNKMLKDGNKEEVELSEFEFILLNELVYKLGNVDAEVLSIIITNIKTNEIINQ